MAETTAERERPVAEHSDRAVSGSVRGDSVDPGMPASTEDRFAAALEMIASAVAVQAESNAKLATTFEEMGRQMFRLTGIISGAQKKIGGEMGKNVEQSKETNRKLAAELELVRQSRANS